MLFNYVAVALSAVLPALLTTCALHMSMGEESGGLNKFLLLPSQMAPFTTSLVHQIGVYRDATSE